MKIRFWGVRGSTPTTEPGNARYGGNTPCIEVRLQNGTLIVFDCGTGLRLLGKHLLAEFGQHPIAAHIFLTHYHWDHLQGLPFFAPLYGCGNTFLFYSHVRKSRTRLKSVIEGQMSYPFFPVDLRATQSTRRFCDFIDKPINIEGALISSAPMHHPQGCAGYRIEADGATFVLATDTEPGSSVHDRAVRELARNADVLVYDCQYTPEELSGPKRGWGHSSWFEGTAIAGSSGVKRLVMFHHDPDHDDAFVDGLVANAQREFENSEGAREGLELELSGRGSSDPVGKF
jgi:phosphoribosyl 1,2-cyclic phosphodiesterase